MALPSPEIAVERRRFRYMLDERGPAPALAAPARVAPAGEARIAVISTPRSGNTLLRSLLAGVLELTELPVHHPADLDWADLPARAVIQLHWPRTAYLERLLAAHGVRVVSLLRHPLDVLVSMLAFAQTEPETANWLWGEGGDEDALVGADPTDERFARWTRSPRARALLGVSPDWAAGEGVARASYDRLIEAPVTVVDQLLAGWDLEARRPAAPVAAALSPAAVNRRGGLLHAWTATSGLWKEVLPSPLARELLGRYTRGPTDGGPDVSVEQARARWAELSPDPVMPAGSYAADLAVLDPPGAAAAGGTVSCLVKVRNAGTYRWPAGERSPRVRLGCRWTRPGEDGVVLEDRQALAGPLAPGQLVYQPATFRAPDAPGTYRLAVDLVHEAVRWFDAGVDLTVTVG